MSPKPTQTTIAAVAFLLTAILPLSGYAGTGFAVSGPTSIDTFHPVVTVTDPPQFTVLQGGQSIDLSWEVNDDNPNSAPAANVAQMWIGDILAESLPFSPGTGQHAWTWTVPDTSSARFHLVVRSADTFGNLTEVAAANFTVLSTASDVPTVAAGPVFAKPAPNPFNPMTQLHFNLPEAGPALVTVHDARGSRLATLVQSNRPSGQFTLRWNGTDDAGRRQAGGVYFFRLQYQSAGQEQQIVHKAVLLP